MSTPASAHTLINAALAKAFAPRKALTVSEWADAERHLSKKGSAEPGPWRTDRNPPLREPMDALSGRSTVRDVVLMFPIQFGKALALDTPIPTPDGWTTMGEIESGDQVMGADGKPATVLVSSPIFHDDPCYRLTFSDGETITANASHLWKVVDTQTRNSARNEIKKRERRDAKSSGPRPRAELSGDNQAHTRILTTDSIAAQSKTNGTQSRYAIPLTQALELPPKDLPIDPYLLGVWLGDGSFLNAGLTLFVDDYLHIIERIESAGHPCKVTPDNDQRSVSVRVNNLHRLLKPARQIGQKQIPIEYLRASRHQRLALLQGLLDTDGHAQKNGAVEICSSHPALAEGIIELIRSLGFKPKSKTRKTKCRDSVRITFHAYAESNIFSLPRKANALPAKGPRYDDVAAHRYITHIEPIPSVPTRCIAVDNADHLYLAGWGMIPTHNTEIAANTLGYTMAHNPGPVMVCLPGEVSMHKWVNQKLNPMIEETPAVANTLDSLKSRDASNTKTFKDFAGGQLYLEHAGSPSRLKSTSVRTLIVDELDEFANNFSSGDDPLDMLLGRTSAFPTTHKRLFISTPGIQGISRTEELWQKSDQRRYHITCPHCGHEQHLEWTGLKWSVAAQEAWYVCADCGVCIEEHHKTDLIRNGRWIAAHPERKLRGYHINCLYYQIGLGPRWNELARMWLDCQNDPARLKTFINDRLAEPWEDRSTRLLKLNIIADRAEDYRLREAPNNVLTLTAGVDTQDNRLAVQIVGWGKGFTCWILDYVELMGDPAEDDVWLQLTDLINRPIERADGTLLSIQATAIDAGGHRTEAVKAYCRLRHIRRPMAIFGAVPNNAPVLSRPKFQEIKWRNTTDKKGVIQHVGTVAIKNVFFSWLSVDGDAEPEKRRVHFSKDLDRFYFEGIVSETFDPRSNRYVKKRGARNEPLDTWVYAYAAAHHSELRYHTYTQARWDALADSLKPRTAASPMIQQSPDTPTRSASTSQKQLTPYYIPD